ncbi:MAG: MFS transporter [Saprospiraceae bacterium]
MSISRINKNALFSALSLHIVVLICWVAYTFYQPKLFMDFGFEDLSIQYENIQKILLVLIPPIAGFIADKYFGKKEKLLLFMLVSLMITACIFLASAGIFINKSNPLIQYVPVFMILWVIGMNIFYSPGLNIISQSAAQTGWSFASAVTGAATDIVLAIVPLLLIFFDTIGSVITFMLGGLLLILVSYLYFKSHQKSIVLSEHLRSKFPFFNIGQALLIGICLGFIHHHILHEIKFDLIKLDHELVISILMLFSAAIIIYNHNKMHKYGYVRLFIIGFVLCLLAYLLVHNFNETAFQFIACIIMVGGLVGVTGCAFAASLEKVNPFWSNTATGFILCGFNLMALF